MLKRSIKYEDFNGNEVTEDFYFNISKPELIDLEVEHAEGFKEMIEKIIATNDRKGLIEQFKKIVLLAYGEKSDDGKRFVKNEWIREAFSQTPAYETLFMELATNDGAAVEFLTGVLPRDLRGEMDKIKSAPPTGPVPPTPPTTPAQPSSV